MLKGLVILRVEMTSSDYSKVERATMGMYFFLELKGLVLLRVPRASYLMLRVAWVKN